MNKIVWPVLAALSANGLRLMHESLCKCDYSKKNHFYY